MKFYQDLPKPFFVLAPLDDVTDTVFRRIIADCAAPDVYFTEFVNADGLQSPGRPRLIKKLQMTALEMPLVAQIWGKVPDNFYKTARQLVDGTFAEELGLPAGVQFAGIDLNMGCPEKAVVNNGCCSALIRNPELALEIIRATQAGADGKLPVSVKTRLGFNEVDLSWHELLLKQNLDVLTVHGRTRKEMSMVPANWERIGAIRQLRDDLKVSTLIVGNGDVENRAHGITLAEQYRLDGIMIGRGVFHDPFAFAASSPWQNYDRQARVALYRKHVQLFLDTWKHNERAIHTLNKFCKIYINGFDGAKEFRDQLMHAGNADELLALLATDSSLAKT